MHCYREVKDDNFDPNYRQTVENSINDSTANTNTSAGDQRTIPMLCMVFMFGLFIPSFIPQQSITSTTFGRTLLSVSKSHVSATSYTTFGRTLLSVSKSHVSATSYTTFGRTLLSVSKSHVSATSYKFISFFSYFPNSDEIRDLILNPCYCLTGRLHFH